MIRVIVINIQNETANAYDFKQDTLALNYVTKLYHIPPQSRFMVPVMVYDYFGADKYIVNKISDMISAMIPSDRETMTKWMEYDLYFHTKGDKLRLWKKRN